MSRNSRSGWFDDRLQNVVKHQLDVSRHVKQLDTQVMANEKLFSEQNVAMNVLQRRIVYVERQLMAFSKQGTSHFLDQKTMEHQIRQLYKIVAFMIVTLVVVITFGVSRLLL
ncbi:unnamed protein product [Adineta ricciae]|uniref:Uncharacterized protein n=1 Tax=Adineta ricciae TaxID=249248 RepID=A0A815TV46_ADIRI|nr:unnamed protein product [Adineta ricciae]